MTIITLPAYAYEPELPELLDRLGAGVAAYAFYSLPPEEIKVVEGAAAEH